MNSNRQSNGIIQFSIRTLLVVPILLAVSFLMVRSNRAQREHQQLVSEIERLQQENEDLQFRALLQHLGSNLRIPTATLYHRYMPIETLNQMRTEGLREARAEHLVTIRELQNHSVFQPQVLAGSGFIAKPGYVPDSETYWESYEEHLSGSACRNLSKHLRDPHRFGPWLAKRPKLVEDYLRPLLLRIAEAPDPTARYDAIEAMLLLGDRSDDILRILIRSIEQPAKEPLGLTESRRKQFHDVDPVRAQQLIDQFDLASLIDE